MTRLTSIRITEADDKALSTIGRGIAEVFRAGLDRELSEHETGDIWVGTGVWRGWRLTTAHNASCDGAPVLVGPDGVGRGPGDI